MEQGERRMTNEELKQEAKIYSYKLYHSKAWNPGEDMLVKAYLAGAEPREKQIQIDAEQIRALQKQNGELKEKYVKNITDCDICDTYCNSQLTKAKEIIREFVEWANWQGNSKCPSFKSIQNKAEQFLSEVEK